MQKVLIIKENRESRIIFEYDLLKAGFDVTGVSSAEEGISVLLNLNIDLVIMDWNISGKQGFELIKEIKKVKNESILIVISEYDDEKELLDAFSAGADDYIGGKFTSKVLIARINAKLNRIKNEPQKMQFLNLEVKEGKRKLLIDKKEISLTKKEYELIKYFILNNNIVLSRKRLLNDLWGYDYNRDTRIVDVYIFNLRRKLKGSKAEIEASRGIGYILKER